MKKRKFKISRSTEPAAIITTYISFLIVISLLQIFTINDSLIAANQKSAQLSSQNSKRIPAKENNPELSQKNQIQNSMGNTVPGEYLVTVSEKTSVEDLKRIFSDYSIVSVTGLDNTPGVFLLKLINDPGIEVLQKTVNKNQKIKAIQPNYIYKTISPRQGDPQ